MMWANGILFVVWAAIASVCTTNFGRAGNTTVAAINLLLFIARATGKM
jgi:hypothetical protein